MTSISQLGMGNTRKTKQKTGGLQLGNGLQLYKFLSCFSWPGWPFSIVLVDVPSLWHQTRPARLGHRRKDTSRPCPIMLKKLPISLVSKSHVCHPLV